MRGFFRRGLAKVLATTLVVSGLTVSGFVTEEVDVQAANYQLVWSDEFNGTSLDRNNWNVEVNGDGGGNNELQYYKDSENNIKVSDGTLKITALKENYNGKSYTSGRITTQGKKYFQYGRIEARMKLPSFSGAWPAFWTLGETYSTNGWPKCGEIDIMEAVNTESTVYGTAHWSYDDSHAEAGQGYNVNRTEWHVYAMEWDSNEIRWYCDDVNYYTLPITDSGQMDELRGQQFILFNLAIGGQWPGWNIDDSAFPNSSTMEVDYVRVYQDPNSTDMTFQTATRDDNWHSYGNWEVKVASSYGTSTAQVAVDPLDKDHIKLQQLSSSWDDANLVQARYTRSGLVPGQKYKISVDLTSSSTDGSYVTDARDDGAAVSLMIGTRTVTKTAVADSNGQISITFGTGWVGTQVVLDFSNVYCRVYDANEVEEVDDTMEFVSVIKDGTYHSYGNWEVQVGAESGSQAQVAVDATDANHIQVKHSQADWSAAYPWSVTARYTAKGLTPGQTYTISARMLTGSTDGSYVSDAVAGQNDTYISYIKGEKYVTKTGVADGNGTLSFAMGFGYSGVGVAIDLDHVTCVAGTVGAGSVANWNYQNTATDDQLHAYGNWNVYVGTSWSGSAAKVGVDPSDADHIRLVPTASNWIDAWSLQAAYTKSGLTPGKKYKLTVELTAISGDGSYIADNDRVTYPLQLGTKTIKKVVEADSNGQVAITFGFGYVGVDVALELDNVKCVEYSETSSGGSVGSGGNTGGSIETPTEAPTEAPTTPSTPSTSGNLAAGKTATASSSEADGMGAQYAVDSNTGTRWASGWSDNEWLTVDLGATYSVNKVVLNWEGAYGSAYKIQTSTDGTNWTTVKDLTGQDGGIDTIEFTATNARYVRMQGVTRGLPYGYSLYEMEVYGGAATSGGTTGSGSNGATSTGNIATGKTVTTSGTENDAMVAANAVDGDTGTRWSSNYSDDAWITVDLGQTYAVNKVVLNWEGAYGSAYKIQTSTDGSNWTTVKDLTGQDGGIDTIEFTATNARYVRMQGVTRALPYGYSLWEMEVYATGSSSGSGSNSGSNNDSSATYGAITAVAASASGAESDAMGAQYAIDGNTGTRWSSNFADNAWITVDLGKTYSVDKVELNWEGAYGSAYMIQTSTDGVNWTTVSNLSGQDGGIDTVTFNATNARYVRMQGVTRALPYGYSLWEMTVYGK